MPAAQSICVYCASSSKVDQKYKDCAHDLGVFLAENQKTIVYGGGHVGLMGIVADSALSAGGDVIGVIPNLLKDKEVAHENLTQLLLTDTMQERQAKMAELSDAFIVMPGGLGTLAEFFEIVTWKQLGLHDKPIAIFNQDGYWDLLLETLGHAQDKKFMYHTVETLFSVCPDFNSLKTWVFNLS